MLAVFGESVHYIESVKSLNSSIANAMRTFPQKYKHLNIVLRTFQSRIRNWKRAFRKFGKFEEQSSKFLENRKLEAISNEWTLYLKESYWLYSKNFIKSIPQIPHKQHNCEFIAVFNNPYTWIRRSSRIRKLLCIQWVTKKYNGNAKWKFFCPDRCLVLWYFLPIVRQRWPK